MLLNTSSIWDLPLGSHFFLVLLGLVLIYPESFDIINYFKWWRLLGLCLDKILMISRPI